MLRTIAFVVFYDRMRPFPKVSAYNRFVLTGLGPVLVHHFAEVFAFVERTVDIHFVP